MYDRSIEETYYRTCKEHGHLEIDRNKAVQEKNKNFCIVIPPPNITDVLYIDHALTFTLQDIMTRYKGMNGYEALYQPGLDHAGTAT